MPLNVQVFSTHPPPHYPSADTKPSSSPATLEKFVLRTFQGRFFILQLYFFSLAAHELEKQNEFVSVNLYLNRSNFREKSFIPDLIKTTMGASCFRFASFLRSLLASYFCLQTNYGYIRGCLAWLPLCFRRFLQQTETESVHGFVSRLIFNAKLQN